MVQVLGVPHKMKELLALKEKYGFFLLEDACAAVGASLNGKKVGSFGDMGSFSFYFGHQMSTIEGGIVSTSDKKLYEMLLMLRSHGWSKDLDRESHAALVRQYGIDDFHTPFVFYEPGFNVRSTDLNAMLGLRQIEKLDKIIARRQENHARYLENLGGRLYVQTPPPGATVCSISFGGLAGNVEERRKIVKNLVENGVETRIFSAGNLGLHPFWQRRYAPVNFPMADRVHHCGFFLPNNPSLTLQNVDLISQLVRDALD
jgi:CDP-6-deoxy-D-xylo-4-hexulose-3-dehydrase